MDVRKSDIARILLLVGMAWVGLNMMAWVSASEAETPHGDMAAALQQVPVFQGLDRGRLQKVAAIAEITERKAGDRIIEQGKRLGKMAIALDSEVQIRIDGNTIRVLPPNSLVGEIEFLEDVPATADVALAAPSRVVLLPHQRFQQVMDEDPVLGYQVMLKIARMEANRLRMNNQGQVK